MSFLREVHQVEEHRERPGNFLGPFEREPVDDAAWLVPVTAPSGIAGSAPEPLDIAEKVTPPGLGDDVAEQGPEQPHLAAQTLEGVVGHGDTL